MHGSMGGSWKRSGLAVVTGGLRDRPWVHRPPAQLDHRHLASSLPDDTRGSDHALRRWIEA